MGYSGRYHAASLAAVFVALAIGILIGVGFGSDIVSGTAEDLERSLESDLDEARGRVGELEAELEREAEFGELAYPALVDDRLRGREVAIVGLGGLGEDVAADVRAALEPSGATLQEVAVVREPPDAASVAEAVRGGPAVPGSRAEALELGSRLAGRLLVRGGRRFDDLRSVLLSRYSGSPGGIDAVVLVRQPPPELAPREAENAAALEEALIEGIRSARATLTGVERSDAEESSVPFFSDRGVNTVDNVETPPGKVALIYALGGDAEGNFGVKETAGSLLPDLLAPPGFPAGGPARG